MTEKPRWQQVKEDAALNPDKYAQSSGEAYQNLAQQAQGQTTTQQAQSKVQSNLSGQTPSSNTMLGALPEKLQPVVSGAIQGAKDQLGIKTQQYTTEAGEGVVYGPDGRMLKGPGFDTQTIPGVVYGPDGKEMTSPQPDKATPQLKQPAKPEEDYAGLFDVDQKTDMFFQGAYRKLAFMREQEAAENKLKGLNELKDFTQKNLDEELVLIESSYQRQFDNLKIVQDTMEASFAKQQEAIDAGATAQLKEFQAAYQANKDVYDYQRKKTELAYQEMINVQEINNKKRLLAEEAQIARLGAAQFGAFEHIQNTILQNEFQVKQLKKEGDLEDQKITKQIKNLNDEYAADVSKVHAWKAESLSGVYTDYSNFIRSLKDAENMTVEQKMRAVQDAKERANNQIAGIARDSLNFQYEVAVKAGAQVESIIHEKNAAVERAKQWQDQLKEDAKADMTLLLGNNMGKRFGALDEITRDSMARLERESGMPPGFMENALERINREFEQENRLGEMELDQMESETAMSKLSIEKYFTDQNGNVTAVVNSGGVVKTVPLGTIDETSGLFDTKQWQFELDRSTGEMFKTNPYTGEVVKIGPDDYRTMANQALNEAAGSVVAQEWKTDHPEGSVGGECGVFVKNFIDTAPIGGVWSNSYETRRSKKMNQKLPTWRQSAQVGDVILTDEHPTYGHLAIVNKVDYTNRTITITESNYRKNSNGQGIVNHTRTLSLDSPKITGAYRGPLKSKYETVKEEVISQAGYDAEKQVKSALEKNVEAFAGGGIFGLAGSVMRDYITGAEGAASEYKSIEEMENKLLQEFGMDAPKIKNSKTMERYLKEDPKQANEIFRQFIEDTSADIAEKKAKDAPKYQITLPS